ncbi:hypothetical protein ATL42_1064 [Sanguibacter antarcticus]|uniref:Uncharacterized protein n=1 Tax=Sanguibacter antarcticus TaxID=372484 RepID=A0A2A9E2X8_9MICO|nr:hypothetical protein ATL42_1064 [Sanguibacter antarcticus]
MNVMCSCVPSVSTDTIDPIEIDEELTHPFWD